MARNTANDAQKLMYGATRKSRRSAAGGNEVFLAEQLQAVGRRLQPAEAAAHARRAQPVLDPRRDLPLHPDEDGRRAASPPPARARTWTRRPQRRQPCHAASGSGSTAGCSDQYSATVRSSDPSSNIHQRYLAIRKSADARSTDRSLPARNPASRRSPACRQSGSRGTTRTRPKGCRNCCCGSAPATAPACRR